VNENQKATITAMNNLVVLTTPDDGGIVLLNSNLTFQVGIRMIFAALLSKYPALIDLMNLCTKGFRNAIHKQTD
jgi:hypothetical protein